MFLFQTVLLHSGRYSFEEERKKFFVIYIAQRHQLFIFFWSTEMSRLGKSCRMHERKTDRLSYITDLSSFALCLDLLKLTCTLHNYCSTGVNIPYPKTFKRTLSFPFSKSSFSYWYLCRKTDYFRMKGALLKQRAQCEVYKSNVCIRSFT